MSQIIIITDRAGRAAPHFKCGRCGDIIKEANMALLTWNPEDRSPQATIITCKKEACSDIDSYSIELDLAWFFLKNNSQIDLKSVLQKARFAASI